jgi:hypothetical protein
MWSKPSAAEQPAMKNTSIAAPAFPANQKSSGSPKNAPPPPPVPHGGINGKPESLHNMNSNHSGINRLQRNTRRNRPFRRVEKEAI